MPLVAVLAAQTDAGAQNLAELLGRPIARVRYDPPVPGRDAERDTELRPGTRIDRGLIRRAIDRLWRTGRFSQVRVLLEPAEARSVVVVVETRPLLRLTGVSVEGADVLAREEIERLVGFQPDVPVWTEDLPLLEATVERGYQDRGYRGARVSARLLPGDEPDDATLELRVREGAPVLVSSVRLVGDLGLPRWRVVDALSFERGDVYDLVQLRARLDSVLAYYRERGFLAASFGEPAATDRPDGTVAVRIPVDAGPRFDFQFRGNRSIAPDALHGALDLEEERRLDAVSLEEARKRLERFYRLNGFLHAEIRIAQTEDVQRRVRVRTVTFLVHEGRQMRIVSLRFPGGRHFREAFLREQVYSYVEEDVPVPGIFQPVDQSALDRLGPSPGVPRGLPRERRRAPLRVVARTVYEKDAYEEAIEHIRELYKADGYLGVRVEDPVVFEREDRLALKIAIVEGVQTRISEVVLEGNHFIASRELLETADIPRGVPLSYERVEEARTRLVDRLQEEGLYYASVEPAIDFSETRERARVRFVVEEGPYVRITRIVVRGNTRTSAGLIRDRVAFEPGDAFRPSRARRSQERLVALGVFQGATVEPEAKDLPESEKVLVVTVLERLPQYMELRGGFSTGQGARGGFEYRYRNLFGYALALRFRIELGYQVFFLDSKSERNFRRLSLEDQLERRLSVGLELPHTPGLGDMSTAIEVALMRENERDFGYDKLSGILSFSTSAVPRFTPRLEVGIEENDFEYFEGRDLRELLERNPRFRRVLRAPEGQTRIGLVRPSIAYDLRDNPFAPSKGIFATLGTEYVESFAARFPSQFVRLSTLLSGYVPLGSEVVLAVSGRFGRVFHVDPASQTYPDRRFYLGGFDTVRGFLDDSMIPEDLAAAARQDPELAALALPGGDAFITGRTELRFPIGFGFQGGIFFDAGNLWSDPQNLFEPFLLRTSAGAGIRYTTPVGPLAFDYGVNLAPREYLDEAFGAFHFSIGVF